MAVDPVLRSIINAIALILLLYCIAIPFFVIEEGMSLVDAFYFTSVTITTVGYGDVVPKSDAGKVFTVFLLFSGVSIFFYHIMHLGQFREREIDPHIQRRLQILRNLTFLQSGDVESAELKKIKEKMFLDRDKGSDKEKGDDRNQGFGRL